MDPEVVNELNASMQELNETLRGLSGSVRTTGEATAGAARGMSALEAAEKQAGQKIQETANNFKTALSGAANATLSFAKAAVSAEEGLKKYGNALNSAGDAAFNIGKNFGILGTIIGGVVKGIGMLAGEALKMHDSMIQMNREATKFAGVIPGTVNNMAELSAQAGYAGEKMLKLVSIAQGVGTNLVALGGTAGSGVIKFQQLANVGDRVYSQFVRMGVSQESLTKMQADYVRLQGMSGQAYALQNKSMAQLQRESVGYAENLVKMSAITGQQAEDLQREREAVKSEFEEQAKVRQEELAAQRADAEGRHEDARRIRAESAARTAIINQMTDAYGKEIGSQVGRFMRTGAYDEFNSGLATMNLGLENYRAAMGKTTTEQERQALATRLATGYGRGIDTQITMAGDAIQFGGVQLGKVLGITEESLSRSNLAIGKSFEEREAQAQQELEAKKNAEDAALQQQAEIEAKERAIQAQYQRAMLTLASEIIPMVNGGLGLLNDAINFTVNVINGLIDVYNFLRPTLEVIMEVLTKITDFVLWPFLELGGLIAENWESIISVGTDLKDIAFSGLLSVGQTVANAWEIVGNIGEWIGEKISKLGDMIGWVLDKIGGFLGMGDGEEGGFGEWLSEKAGEAMDSFSSSFREAANEARANIPKQTEALARTQLAKDATELSTLVERRSQMRAEQIGNRTGMDPETVRAIGRAAVGAAAGGAGGLGIIGSARVGAGAAGIGADGLPEAGHVSASQLGMLTVPGMEPDEVAQIQKDNIDRTQAHTATTETNSAAIGVATEGVIKDTHQKKENLEQNIKIAKQANQQMVTQTNLFKTFTESLKATIGSTDSLKQTFTDLVSQLTSTINYLRTLATSPLGTGGKANEVATVEGVLATQLAKESGGGRFLRAMGSNGRPIPGTTMGGQYGLSDQSRQSAYASLSETDQARVQQLTGVRGRAPRLNEMVNAAGTAFTSEGMREADTILARQLATTSIRSVSSRLGRPATNADIRGSWWLGEGGYEAFLRDLAANPNMPMDEFIRNHGWNDWLAGDYALQWKTNGRFRTLREQMDKINEQAGGVGSTGSGDMVALANELKGRGQGITPSEHPDFPPFNPGGHEGNAHREGRALDLNIVSGDDSKDPRAAAIFDALKPELMGRGYSVLWRVGGHYDHMHVQQGSDGIRAGTDGIVGAAKGGVFTGSRGGYPATLHGTEVVAPLTMDSVLMKLAKTPATSDMVDEISRAFGSPADAGNSQMDQVISTNRDLLAILTSKMDQVIDALETGNDTQGKILQYSQI